MKRAQFTKEVLRGARVAGVLLTVAAVAGGVVANAQTPTSPLAKTQTVRFHIVLPLQNKDGLEKLIQAQQTPNSPSYHKWLTPTQFQAQFGPSQQSIAWASSAMSAHHLTVTGIKGRVLSVAGSVADVEKAFNVGMWNAITPEGAHVIVSDKAPAAPSELLGTGARIAGIGPHASVTHSNSKLLNTKPANINGPTGLYNVDDLKQAYDWPSYQALDGTGTTIAIMSAADASDSDATAYFSHLGLPTPTITRVTFDGSIPGFDPNNGASVEANLDVQQAGGMAPGANILLYLEPDQTLVEETFSFYYATLDDLADVISNSYGAPEQYYEAYYNGDFYVSLLEFTEEVFAQANVQGISVVNSSGDDGAKDWYSRSYYLFLDPINPPYVYNIYKIRGVDYPASSPHITTVGGTNLVTTYTPGSFNSAYVRENAYFDLFPTEYYSGYNILDHTWGSGGGVSDIFLKPWYQTYLNTGQANRTIPDVSGHMGGCPFGSLPCGPDRSGDVVTYEGGRYGVIGTSASAPDFAGLLALKVQYLGQRLGNVNYDIYRQASLGSDAFHYNIPGDNGWYRSGPGNYVPSPYYNMVVGVGTVDGRNFIGAKSLPAAGIPRTPSNP